MRKQLRLQTMRDTPRTSRIHLPGSGAALPAYSLTDTTPGPGSAASFRARMVLASSRDRNGGALTA
jgi:hypothetical protein